MEANTYLLDIALILLSTKLLGLFSRRLKMPQVVGALLAGLLLGPAGLNVLQGTEFISRVAELGVIILMFTAGLETDVVELRRAGKASFVIALIGVLVPLAGGFGVAVLFNRGELAQAGGNVLLQNVFLGVILTATSVSITVETLKELGKLDTRVGSAILGAALIDDILGILALTVISSFADESVSIWAVTGRIGLFFVCLAVVAVLFSKLFAALIRIYRDDMRRFAILAFVFCLALSYCAEAFFDVADITGAYFAGLIICNTQKTKYIASRFETLSFLLLSPIFFASIGIGATLPHMSGTVLAFTGLLLLVAIGTKVMGCGLGAKLCGYTREESVQIGIGMVSRGEVALIVAHKGNDMGLISEAFYGPIIVMVIATTVLTPVLLKLVVGRQTDRQKYGGLVESRLVDRYSETDQFDLAQQELLRLHEDYLQQEREDHKG
ncbi:Na(+)/H(+)-K(+) antiporter GerN [bioreactor metagenome]|uniref:Na(+)/H(+)-K(+) antiporter GerN n=1 Tax=bioreactor metagenome TaxID=1076179 RepID=A0A644Y1B0_9ZZZZ